ncbi:MAG: methionine--tRNA ligase subunit beta, partial [Candidatus Heimdallarchaeota archaeon]
FAPSSAEKVYSVLGYSGQEVHDVKWVEVNDWNVLVGQKIVKLDSNLFIKIPNKDISRLEEIYGSAAKGKGNVKKKTRSKPKQLDGNLVEYHDFAKLKLITAKILRAEKHPKADNLIVLTVDDGKRQDRTICAGIAGEYDPSNLVNKQIVIIDNLKPRKLRGIISEGMVLAAEDENGISLLQPDRKISTGVQVR